MPGQLQHADVSADDQELVNSLGATLHASGAEAGATFTVNAVWNQVVAGTIKFYHLTSSTGGAFSTAIFIPLPHTGEPAQVLLFEAGHTEARNPN